MYSPKPNPGSDNPDIQALANYLQEELQAIARTFGETQELELRPRSAEPDKPRDGMIVQADGTNWNPGSGAGTYARQGGAWVLLRSGAEPNTYGVMTDGATNAPADAAGDTFKFRGANGVKVTVTNDDATHGDNVLHEIDVTGLSSVTPALDDKVLAGDTSASDTLKRVTPQTLLDLIGSLTTDSTPDMSADFLASYDASASAAKKVPLLSIPNRVLISSTLAGSGSTFDVTIPTGYRDLIFYLHGLSGSSTGNIRVAFSEDAGSTFKTVSSIMFNNGGATTESATVTVVHRESLVAGSSLFGTMILYDYTGSNDKFVSVSSLEAIAPNGSVGSKVILSTGVPNLARFSLSTGNFDAGKVELWGIP